MIALGEAGKLGAVARWLPGCLAGHRDERAELIRELRRLAAAYGLSPAVRDYHASGNKNQWPAGRCDPLPGPLPLATGAGRGDAATMPG